MAGGARVDLGLALPNPSVVGKIGASASLAVVFVVGDAFPQRTLVGGADDADTRDDAVEGERGALGASGGAAVSRRALPAVGARVASRTLAAAGGSVALNSPVAVAVD